MLLDPVGERYAGAEGASESDIAAAVAAAAAASGRGGGAGGAAADLDAVRFARVTGAGEAGIALSPSPSGSAA
jgi:hypothetical protein